MKKLIVVRGVPGTGKSTYAKNLQKNICPSVVLEADMYFTVNSGLYEFDFQKLRWAHDWCLTTTKAMLLNDMNVIVANTFTTWKELRPYISFAVEFGIEFEIVTMTQEYGSVHGVPEEKMQAMRDRFVPHENIMETAVSLLEEHYTN